MKNNFSQEQIGFVIGYTAAFVVDNVVKVNAIKYGYKTVSWVATKTKIDQLPTQVLFERAIDAVMEAY